MTDKSYIQAVFADEHEVVSAMEALQVSAWRAERVHSPFPIYGLTDILKQRRSTVGFFTLVGGIVGFLVGFGLSAYTAGQYSLIISGKPVLAWIPFVIVGFEFTILFSVFGNILGVLVKGRLPDFKALIPYNPRFSGDRFGIVASCRKGEEEGLMDFLRGKGAEVEILEDF